MDFYLEPPQTDTSCFLNVHLMIDYAAAIVMFCLKEQPKLHQMQL